MDIQRERLSKTLGFAFERWCAKNQNKIAKILGIHKLNCRAGEYFYRGTEGSGFQIDLMFIVEEIKLIFCEIKYYSGKVGSEVTHSLDEKIARFLEHASKKYKKSSIEKVLITTEGIISSPLIDEYFSEVITLDALFEEI